MERKRLVEILERIQGLRVAVLGDLFLDAWMDIDPALDEASLETGRTAFQVVGSRYRAGRQARCWATYAPWARSAGSSAT